MSAPTPLVTVVIPTHNRRALLEDAVDSVLGQAAVDLELVIVNDASSDDTDEYLATVSDERVATLSLNSHGERSIARNSGLDKAAGRYVLFLDDDDMLLPGALAALSTALAAVPRAVLAVGGVQAFNDDDGQRRRMHHPRRRMVVDPMTAGMWGWVGVPGATLFVTQALRDVGGWPQPSVPCEDQELTLRLAEVGPTVLVPDDVLDHRRHRGQYRPPEVPAIERDLRQRFIDDQPAGSRRRRAAESARATREAAEAGLAAWTAGQRWTAFVLLNRAVRHSPRLLLSPLVGARFRSLWLRAAVGLVAGPRLTRAAQRAVWKVRSRRGTAPDGAAPLVGAGGEGEDR